MKKLIVLFSVFIFIAIVANAQGVVRDSYCIDLRDRLGGPGPLSFFGCEHIWTLEAYICFNSTYVYGDHGLVVAKTNNMAST